ncbi:hypothetical protein QF030_007877 [Streptomyces rishiriensis]|uniref:Transposase n=1 Tax=Streptomyces rishiriensis TaxID=68264 RepID=A0ABU0P2U7_STRRH|nr:hypothetical protein [Streptomyces rishiriensis]
MRGVSVPVTPGRRLTQGEFACRCTATDAAAAAAAVQLPEPNEKVIDDALPTRLGGGNVREATRLLGHSRAVSANRWSSLVGR